MSSIEKWLLFAVAFTVAPSVRADEPHAKSLFDEARTLMAEGRYAEACPKLEESQRMDPGVGTQFNLARCYELSGRLATAWSTYTRVATATHAAGQMAREAIARERLAALAPRLSYLAIVAPGTDASDLRILRDGEPVGASHLGVEVPVDVGRHEIRAMAPGKRDWQRAIDVVKEGEHLRVEVPVLDEAAPVPAPVPPVHVERAVAPPAAPSHAASVSATRTAHRAVAISLAAGGVVAAGVGTFFGLRAFARSSDADGHCDARGCDSDGYTLRHDSLRAGDISTVSFAIAGGLVVAAGVAWFTAPSPSSRKQGLYVAPSAGGLLIGGHWQ